MYYILEAACNIICKFALHVNPCPDNFIQLPNTRNIKIHYLQKLCESKTNYLLTFTFTTHVPKTKHVCFIRCQEIYFCLLVCTRLTVFNKHVLLLPLVKQMRIQWQVDSVAKWARGHSMWIAYYITMEAIRQTLLIYHTFLIDLIHLMTIMPFLQNSAHQGSRQKLLCFKKTSLQLFLKMLATEVDYGNFVVPVFFSVFENSIWDLR